MRYQFIFTLLVTILVSVANAEIIEASTPLPGVKIHATESLEIQNDGNTATHESTVVLYGQSSNVAYTTTVINSTHQQYFIPSLFDSRIKKDHNANMYVMVEKNDTLYSIARNSGVPLATLKKINNLSKTTISIGQKLYILKSK